MLDSLFTNLCTVDSVRRWTGYVDELANARHLHILALFHSMVHPIIELYFRELPKWTSFEREVCWTAGKFYNASGAEPNGATGIRNILENIARHHFNIQSNVTSWDIQKAMYEISQKKYGCHEESPCRHLKFDVKRSMHPPSRPDPRCIFPHDALTWLVGAYYGYTSVAGPHCMLTFYGLLSFYCICECTARGAATL